MATGITLLASESAYVGINNFYFNVSAADMQSVADFWRTMEQARRLGRMK